MYISSNLDMYHFTSHRYLVLRADKIWLIERKHFESTERLTVDSVAL